MRIVLASDHAGFTFKELIKEHLIKIGHEVTDCGAFSSERSDYPDFAKIVAGHISKSEADRGILICGSGIGMCIAANRFLRVRAVVIRDRADAEMSRRHNDANVMCLGERVTEVAYALELADIFLTTPFEGGRHEIRVEKIDRE